MTVQGSGRDPGAGHGVARERPSHAIGRLGVALARSTTDTPCGSAIRRPCLVGSSTRASGGDTFALEWRSGRRSRRSSPRANGDGLDVLVTCHPHAPTPQYFPQVRGFYLARHLARSGLRAQFRQLPVRGIKCEVLICSEYQSTAAWFERQIAGPLAEIRSSRAYCLTDAPVAGRSHFSSTHCEWFAQRGGILFQLPVVYRPADHEHFIGLGVDADVIRGQTVARCRRVRLSRSGRRDTASSFDPAVAAAVRTRVPECRLVGTGPADAVVRPLFDEWVEYGQPHRRYVARAFRGAVAFVPGGGEAMGLSVAEAQVAGACVVASEGQVEAIDARSGAGVSYLRDDGDSLAEAILEARSRRRDAIAASARRRFDMSRVVVRTRAAVSR